MVSFTLSRWDTTAGSVWVSLHILMKPLPWSRPCSSCGRCSVECNVPHGDFTLVGGQTERYLYMGPGAVKNAEAS